MGSVKPPAKSFPPGIHVPSLTWFKDDLNQDIDWDVQRKHLNFLITSGLHSIVLAGTNGEAVTLTADEKIQLIRVTREIAIQVGRPDITIVLGCGGQCTRDVIAETKLAQAAGADFALVLVPSYFHFAMDEAAIISFFEELADASPIPILIYNFPGVAAGLDVHSDMSITLGAHPNIAGVKLTCGGIAKVARIRATYNPEQFAALAGQSDWLLPGLVVGGIGAITGLANLYPRACIQVFDLYNAGEQKEAEKEQLALSTSEWGFSKEGINGTKWVVAKYHGYPESSCHCRRPYPKYLDEKKQAWITEVLRPLGPVEKALYLK